MLGVHTCDGAGGVELQCLCIGPCLTAQRRDLILEPFDLVIECLLQLALDLALNLRLCASLEQMQLGTKCFVLRLGLPDPFLQAFCLDGGVTNVVCELLIDDGSNDLYLAAPCLADILRLLHSLGGGGASLAVGDGDHLEESVSELDDLAELNLTTFLAESCAFDVEIAVQVCAEFVRKVFSEIVDVSGVDALKLYDKVGWVGRCGVLDRHAVQVGCSLHGGG